jgi:hypothetical protein
MVYFQTKNPNLGKKMGLAMEEVGLFYGPLVYFTGIGIIYGHL